MGHYIQANSTLKIKVTLAYPLATPTSVAAKVEPEATFEVCTPVYIADVT